MISRFLAWLNTHKTWVAQATALSVAVVASFIAIEAVHNLALLANAEQFVSDWEVAALSPPEPQDPDIVIVAVNEDTLSRFAYRSPVDRAFLANLVTTLAKRGPRAIGIDFLFDQPTEADKDAALKKALRAVKVPMAVAYSDDPRVVTKAQRETLDNFVPSHLRAYATLAEDQLNVVRWIFPGAISHDGQYIPGFARAIAGKLGAHTSTAQIPIVWHGHPGNGVPAFRKYPAHLVPILPAAWFKNKVVLIGSDLSLTDRHRTPFDVVNPVQMAGIEIQAHAVSQLLHGRYSPDVGQIMNLLIIFMCAAMGARLGAMNIALLARVGGGIGFVIALWAGGAALFHFGGYQIMLIAPSLAMALALWATESLTGREARKQREFIHGAFSHYVAPKVVEAMVHDPSRMSLAGERRVMTYLFSDIEGFTTMSETMDSKELAKLLNSYLDGATEEVLRFDGMVDKFIGDAVFAIFNAPVDMEDHAGAAVRCALAMDKFTLAFSQEQRARGIPFGITRIGVHTGPAVIGNFGSRSRFNYTAQGDAVNVAARLESLNKHFHTRLCVSGATKDLCKGIAFRPIAEVTLKGKTAPIEVWEPLHDDAFNPAYLGRYDAAYRALKAGEPAAVGLFDALADAAPDDPLVALHRGRLGQGISGAVIVMDEK